MVFDANEFFNEHHSEPEEVSLPKRSPNDFSIGELLANHVSVLFVMAGINTDDYTQGVYSSLWNRKLKKEMVRILNAGQDTNVQRIQEKIAEINSYGSSLNNDIEHVDQQPEPESVKDEADGKGKKGKVGRRDEQITLIIKEAKKLEYDDLLNIPEGGRAEILKSCLENEPSLFTKSGFDRAWTEANSRNLIRMKDKEKYL